MIRFLQKGVLSCFLFCVSFICFAHDNKNLSTGLSLDYGFGKAFNNYASTVHFNYKLFPTFQLAPSFSYYLAKEDIRMRNFSLNVHYLLPKLMETIFPIMRNQGLCLYPLAGISITAVSGFKSHCDNCSTNATAPDSKFWYNFGFAFGAGVSYELPTLLPLLRDIDVNFEMQYQAIENYSRPVFVFGVLYNF